MDPNGLRELMSPRGQVALAAAAALEPTEETFLACYETVRKAHDPGLAKGAVEMAVLRAKARAKFSRADRMYFTREALEQASGEAISRHRAARFAAFESVADLGCGIGGDSLGLAAAGPWVEAVDGDPLRLAMAAANAEAHGVDGRVNVRTGDVLTMSLPPTAAAFADPSRRAEGRRFLSLADYFPPPAALRARFPADFPLAFKVAPGIARADLAAWDAEAEFVSVGGELKECVLWCGPLRTAARRATVLPGPHTLVPEAGWVERDAGQGRPPSDPLDYLFDPDSAVIRAELEHTLAERLDAFPLDWSVALFSGRTPAATPFADCYRVEHRAPFHLGRLRDYLRERRVGRVTVLKRASELDANEVTRKLRLDGPEHRHLILTRSMGRPMAVVAEKMA